MSNYRIVQRYAHSLISLADDQNALEEVIKDVNLVLEVLEHRDFYLLMKSPVIKPGNKKEICRKLFSDSVHKLTLEFMMILIRKGREKLIAEIFEGARDEYNRLKGITKVTLVTAVKADQALIDKVIATLEKMEDIKQVDLKAKVDPDIIGGMVLDFGDKVIDSSIKFELNSIRKQFYSLQIKEKIT
nr:ATP synthase F1 subunit delta [Saprospiraceae bacterium]